MLRSAGWSRRAWRACSRSSPSWCCDGESAGRSNRAGRRPRRSPGRPWSGCWRRICPARGLVKEFYLRLTGIVRQYVEDTTGIRAPEQTTEEFLRDMRSRAAFPPERSVRLAEFLEAADLIKYAGQQPEEGQIDQAIARAHEFVNLKPAPAAVMAGAGQIENGSRVARSFP